MAFISLPPVVELGLLTMVERDKGKPVHRVAQMLVTGEAKVYNATFAAGFGHRHRSRLSLKMTRGLRATLGIAELGRDRRHEGSAFPPGSVLANSAAGLEAKSLSTLWS